MVLGIEDLGIGYSAFDSFGHVAVGIILLIISIAQGVRGMFMIRIVICNGNWIPGSYRCELRRPFFIIQLPGGIFALAFNASSRGEGTGVIITIRYCRDPRWTGRTQTHMNFAIFEINHIKEY
jgi:hypothetical protein